MDDSIKKPNFFIIGAPKCGTTSLSRYLGEHSNVFFSAPKEPNYFNTDFSDNFRNIINKKEYLKLFEGAKGYKAVGEGSPLYLYSNEAVSNILEFNPEAKFIIMVRNPVEMFRSLHQQELKTLNENIKDPEKSWNLQEKRRKGKHIPSTSRNPEMLQYGGVCKVGEQVKRLLDIIPQRDRVKVIEFKHFKNNTRETYEETLDFLDLKSDNRESFPVYNKSSKTKVEFIKKVKSLINNKTTNRISRYLKRKIGIKHWTFLVKLRKWNEQPRKKPEISDSFRDHLENYFEEDQELLEKIFEQRGAYKRKTRKKKIRKIKNRLY